MTENVALAMFYGLLIGVVIGAVIMHRVKCKAVKQKRPSIPNRVSDPSLSGHYGFLKPMGSHETNPFKEQDNQRG